MERLHWSIIRCGLFFINGEYFKKYRPNAPLAPCGNFEPSMRCGFLKHTKYSCETTPFYDAKFLAIHSRHIRPEFLFTRTLLLHEGRLYIGAVYCESYERSKRMTNEVKETSNHEKSNCDQSFPCDVFWPAGRLRRQ